MITLALSGLTLGILVFLFLAVSVLLILLVLIQRPQGGGLSGAFGAGAGSGQTAFGAKTGDALTMGTIIMFVVWLLFAVGMVFALRPTTIAVNDPALVPIPGSTDSTTTTTEVVDDSIEDGETGEATEGGVEIQPFEEPAQGEPASSEPSGDDPTDTPGGDGG